MDMAPFQNQYDLIIIGAGLEALHILSRLPEDTLQSTLVIDASTDWLATWQSWHTRLDLTHLRCPSTLHPHQSPLSLKTFIDKHARHGDLSQLPTNQALGPCMPSPQLMYDFCMQKIVKKLPAVVRRIVSTSVTAVVPWNIPSADRDGKSTSNTTDIRDNTATVGDDVNREGLIPALGCIVHCSNGASYTARAVVYGKGHIPPHPVIPQWAQPLLLPQQTIFNTTSGSGVTKGRDMSTCPGLIATWDEVDVADVVSSGGVKGRSVAIIGGGMTAAALAFGAVKAGAKKVTIIARRPLKQQFYDCDVGWWGPKQLNAYRRTEDPIQRWKACKKARSRGTLSPEIWQKLVEMNDTGTIQVFEGCQVKGATAAEDQQHQQEEDSNRSMANIASTIYAFWNLELLWEHAQANDASSQESNAHVTTEFQKAVKETGCEQNSTSPGAILADVIWLACGSAYNADTDPIIQSMHRSCPSRTIGGYPLIDQDTCLWPGAPFYLIGRPALLAVGPAAGDLPGMRLAADRIVASLKKLDYAGEPEWIRIAAKLKPQMNIVDVAEQEGRLQVLPLEIEGAIYEEHKPKVSKVRDSTLIDVSDLPPALPRLELPHYSYIDEDFELTIILQLEESVPLDMVRSKFSERSLEVWAVGEKKAYRLHVPQLYGKVVPERCKIKVNEKKKKVYVVLYKISDAEWKFLKS